MHIRTSAGFAVALLAGMFLVPQALFASTSCIALSGKIAICSDTASPDCTSFTIPGSAKNCSADPASTDYCESVTTDKDCKAMDQSSGCCVCGASPNSGIGSESSCKAKCGSQSAKVFSGTTCADKLVTDYVKSQSSVSVGGNTGAIKIGNPLGTTSIPVIIGRIINIFLSISGSIALFMFVYGGFTWVTSGGGADRIKQGKETMVWATIGIAFIFLSYAVLSYILKILQG
ncbi:hypothetical protein KBD18_02665 [Patescibacteria group bacterium]|nr:hypothetical protein [Patescibacteria group bacterium]